MQHKKLTRRESSHGDEDEPIDFSRLIARGLRMGIDVNTFRHMYLGTYVELFEEYKKLYNFETQKYLYEVEENQRRTSLLDL